MAFAVKVKGITRKRKAWTGQLVAEVSASDGTAGQYIAIVEAALR